MSTIAAVLAARGTPAYDAALVLQREALADELHAQGAIPIGPGGCIEHDPDYREADVDVSVWLPVATGTTVVAPLEVLILPAQDVVMARVEGPYDPSQAPPEALLTEVCVPLT